MLKNCQKKNPGNPFVEKRTKKIKNVRKNQGKKIAIPMCVKKLQKKTPKNRKRSEN